MWNKQWRESQKYINNRSVQWHFLQKMVETFEWCEHWCGSNTLEEWRKLQLTMQVGQEIQTSCHHFQDSDSVPRSPRNRLAAHCSPSVWRCSWYTWNSMGILKCDIKCLQVAVVKIRNWVISLDHPGASSIRITSVSACVKRFMSPWESIYAQWKLI